MDATEAPRLTGKHCRKYSDMTIDTKFTRSSFEEKDSPERNNTKRKVSFDHRAQTRP
jgi:hypothetical protein